MRGFYPLDNAESTRVSGARDFDIANGWSKSLQIAGYIHCTDLSGRLPYSEMVFFARNGTVNLTWRGDPNDPAQDGDCDSIVWRSKPKHRVHGFVPPKGLWITKGKLKEDFGGSRHYKDFLHYLRSTTRSPDIEDYLRELRESKIE